MNSSFDLEQNLKKDAAEQQQTGTSYGSVGTSKCAEPGFRESITSRRYRAESNARDAERLAELEHLLDKNPELARILELLHLTKVY